jgi:hypothetical protein
MSSLNNKQVKQKLVEGEDFYYNENDFIVLTEQYHLQRGYCCGNGCRHCPFNYINVPEPSRSRLQNDRLHNDTDR